MLTFGVIAEGKTDFPVLRNILCGYFTDPAVNRVQPENDEDPAGWSQVFAALNKGKHREALQFNDFVVVHVDTDVCQEKGFDVPVHAEGRALSKDEVLDRVCQRLKELLGAPFLDRYGDRVILAVAVEAIECWLMPLLFRDAKQAKTTGCLRAVNRERTRRNLLALSSADEKQKFLRQYDDASREYRTRKTLLERAPENLSLAHFVFQLSLLTPTVIDRS
ncbi:MAG: hypothetical protein HY904_25295 [Deltaproteobacteria bacterium]|nr:hypothetical protein [Deltaproteobacteria bacterium]